MVSKYLKLKDGRNCICRCRKRLINGREKSTLDTKVEIPSILSLWFVFFFVLLLSFSLLPTEESFVSSYYRYSPSSSSSPLPSTMDVKIKNHFVPFSPALDEKERNQATDVKTSNSLSYLNNTICLQRDQNLINIQAHRSKNSRARQDHRRVEMSTQKDTHNIPSSKGV